MALAARDVRYRCIRGRGWADKEQKNGTSFITKVTIEVHAEVDPEDEKILAHCLDIVKGCMITRSLTHGMEVDIRQI
jgi:organic hydroperoxide reductase OsmC/OhrA